MNRFGVVEQKCTARYVERTCSTCLKPITIGMVYIIRKTQVKRGFWLKIITRYHHQECSKRAKAKV